MTQVQLRRFARMAIAELDEERECLMCHTPMHKEPGLDLSPLCNLCVQTILPEIAAAYLNLLKKRKAKRG